MAWHPATGTGVIALGNSTYAAMAPLAARMLEAVVRRGETSAHGPVVALGSPGPWPETLAARDAAGPLLQSWDDAEAHRLFSPNVAQDAPFEERRRRIALVRERIGELAPTRAPARVDTPAHCRWWLTGERGSVQVRSSSTRSARPGYSRSRWPCRPRPARRSASRWTRRSTG